MAVITRELSKSLVVTVEPTVEPVALSEYVAYRKLTYGNEDSGLTTQLKAARERVESETSRIFITTTLVLRLADFPTREIVLPVVPVQSVTSVQYVDTAGDTQTWAASNYYTELNGLRPTIEPSSSAVWPTVEKRNVSVIVTFKAGYGDAASDVPSKWKQAIMWEAARSDEFREPVATGRLSEVPGASDRTIKGHRLI